MGVIEEARQFLLSAGALELSELLAQTSYGVAIDDSVDWLETRRMVVVSGPAPLVRALESVGTHDQQRILRAIVINAPGMDESLAAGNIEFEVDESLTCDPRLELIAELVCQRELMIAVAESRVRINDANDIYRNRQRKLEGALSPRGMDTPSPYGDLWDWYHAWKANGWDSWAERRKHVRDLFQPILEQLCETQLEPIPVREPTGWERVDRTLEKARSRLLDAVAEEDFQAVGLLCREVLISLGQVVYSEPEHGTPDGVQVSSTDAKRMLDAYIAATVPGQTNETIRRHVKAALALALELQHKRTADFRLAALCLEATSSTVNVLAILEGRRDPQ